MSDEKDTSSALAKGIDVGIKHTKAANGEQVNEAVSKLDASVKPDVPTGLAVIPKGANVHALARSTAGEVPPNKMEFHCASCGESRTLEFDDDEMAVYDNNIRDYTGPCWNCGHMTLTPKSAYWGADFPSMSELATKQKRADARVQAEELVDVVKEAVAPMIAGAVMPKPTEESTAPKDPSSDLPEEADPTKLTPR